MGALTLEQFLALPETEPASEFVCGEVIPKPIPTTADMRLQAYFTVVLFQFLARAGLGMAGPEWRCIFRSSRPRTGVRAGCRLCVVGSISPG